jgi:probable F420-dependent oxidoreductase
MEVGTSVPHIGPMADPKVVVDFCRAADVAGFDGLWFADHVLVPKVIESRYTLRRTLTPYPFEDLRVTMGLNLEINTTLAAAAAVTSTVKLCTGISVLPLRNPVLNARQLASIDLFSGGRLVYGVGVGWMKEEADAMGMPWDHRGRRTDEHIELLRTVWTATGETVEFHGEFYDLPPVDPRPTPVQRPIPILIGGHSEPALDRVARLGDGWIAAGMGADRFIEAMGRLRAACDAHGRDLAGLTVVNGEHPDVLLDPHAPDMSGQVARAVEGLRAYEAMGVTHMKVSIRTLDPSALLETIDVYGREVLPAYRLAR